MSASHRPMWTYYAFAALATIAALLLRVSVGSALPRRPMLIVFVIPIMLSTYLGGSGPGLLATFLSAAGAAYLLTTLPQPHTLLDYEGFDHWLLLLVTGILVSLLTGRLHTARKHQEFVIAELRTSERSLVASEQRLARIIESAMDAIISIDRDQRIILFNASAERMFECSAAQAAGSPIERFIPDWAIESQQERSVLRPGNTSRIDREMGVITGLRNSGEKFPLEAAVSRTQVNGEPLITIILRDSGERLRAEKALREQVELQDRIAKVAASVPGVVCSFRLRPDGSASMPYASPVFEAVYGFPADEVSDDFSPVFERIHPDDIGHIHESIAESARTLSPWRDAFRYRHPTRGEIWIEGHSMPRQETDGSILWHGYIEDVSERKHFEQALRESEQRWHQLAEAMPNMVWSCDPSGARDYLSKQWVDYTGVAEAEQLGFGWLQQVHPDDHDAVLAAWKCAVDTQRPFDMEFRIRRHDGAYRWFKTRARPVRDHCGQIVKWYGSNTDVDDLRETQMQLQKSEDYKRAVLDALPASIAVLDSAGIIRSVNRPWLRFAEENGRAAPLRVAVGADYLAVCRSATAHGDPLATDALEGIEAVLRGDLMHFEMEYPCHAPDAERWFLMHVVNAPAIGGTVVTHLDISQHKRMELALRESDARLRLAAEAADAGLWDRDLITGSVFFSPEWKRQIGYRDDEFPNSWEEWENRLHPSERAQVLGAIEAYLNGRLPHYKLEFRLRHKDGSYRWIHSRGALLRDQQDRPYRLLGMNLDITEHKSLQELSERRFEMEEISRIYVASQTAAAIAHELNQPLTALASYIDVALLMMKAGDPDPDNLIFLLESSARQALRAGQVTRQLSSLLQKGETVTEAMDLNASVREAIAIVKSETAPSKFTIRLELCPGMPPVQANRLQIDKVLINLLRNGQEAMEAAGLHTGTISITTRIAPDDERMEQVTVRDMGTRVDNGALKCMFQPFYSTKPGGLGMGLAISRALIHANGGRLWAEQNLGPGMSFHFTLPIAGDNHDS